MKIGKEKRNEILYIKIAISIILIAIFLLFFGIYIVLINQVSYANSQEKNIDSFKISDTTPINIQKIIEQNAKISITENIITEEIEMEYITQYIENENLAVGIMQVSQEGRTGITQITTKITYENGKKVSQQQISSNIIKAPINKIVQIGSGSAKSTKYIAKIGDKIYATSDRLTVFLENNLQSQKVGTLQKDDEMTIIDISNNWYKIKTNRVIGWVSAESTTYINYDFEDEQTQKQTVAELKHKLNFNMKLNEPSGLTLEQFRKVLSDSKDVNNIFENNAEYFYYIEEQYGINGIFVAAVGIHESSWGTSKLAKNKYNLFGYGANDSNPYNNAYSFDNYAESIDLIARVFTKYYLNPKGTSIYAGEIADGRYYNGNTLNSVNKRYASDSNWANAVYSHMKYLYNKL